MANITIKELTASNSISEIVDKINFNFDQLLLNGGGPRGLIGGPGEIGPIGPRGTLWFTAADIYTTINSPTPWQGVIRMVNDINSPTYPDFKGDPNKYGPSITSGQISPSDSFVIGYSNKLLRDGDLYIQESDDNFSRPSKDGDIWQYDGLNLKWIFTGVNIKGEDGATGGIGHQEWIRENTTTEGDIIYPKTISGNDEPRVLIGKSINPFEKIGVGTLLTLMSDGGVQLGLGNTNLHSGTSGEAEKVANVLVDSTGLLTISGSTSASGTNGILIVSTDPNNRDITITNSKLKYSQSITGIHDFSGGSINVRYEGALANRFENTSDNTGIVLIPHNDHISFSATIGSQQPLILQDNNSKGLGIGDITGWQPQSKLVVAGNVSIGYNSIAPTEGLLVKGQAVFGFQDAEGNSAIRTNKSISIEYGGLLLNANYLSASNLRATQDGPIGVLEPFVDNVSHNTGVELIAHHVNSGQSISDRKGLIISSGRLDSSHLGYVGFGTKNPVEKIHVHDEEILLSPNSSELDTGLRFKFIGTSAIIQRDWNGGSATKYIHQYIGNTPGDNPNITLSYDGIHRKVGINNNIPNSTFHVKGEGKNSIAMGDLDNIAITNLGLKEGTDGSGNLNGRSFIGFNATVDNNYNEVTFISGLGYIIYLDSSGNLRFASENPLISTNPGI